MFNRKNSFLAATTISTFFLISIFADQSKSQDTLFYPGTPIKDDQILAGYPQGASYKVDGLDIFLTADYILWRWNQPIAPVTVITSPNSLVADQFINKSSTTVDLNPHYTSGFQTGVGFCMKGMDDWNAYAEYTWYKNRVTQNLVTGINQSIVHVVPGGQFSSYNQIGSFQSRAKLLFNALDVSLQRPFYLGKRIISIFGLSISNLWITQKLKSNYSGTLVKLFDAFSEDNQSFSDIKQTSWGIGPKIYFNSNWMLGYGLKLIGDVSTSVLYTKQIATRDTEVYLQGLERNLTITSSYYRSKGTYNFTPITGTSLGFGWGSYLCQESFHIDLSAVYDINIYWNYTNMNLDNPENMTLHGLNIQARFDF